jgi:hypothetical protein
VGYTTAFRNAQKIKITASHPVYSIVPIMIATINPFRRAMNTFISKFLRLVIILGVTDVIRKR